MTLERGSMSKELTEQWRNGTLPENWYYIHLKSNWGNIDCITINYCDEDGVFEEYPDEDIKEVLAPVPDYNTWTDFQKYFVKKLELEVKLKEAYETLEEENCKRIGLERKVEELKQKLHILNEANMKLENAIASNADYFRQKISVLESRINKSVALIIEGRFVEALKVLGDK